MNKQLITAIASAVALTQITGCSKTSREPDAAFKAALAERDKRIAELEMKIKASQTQPPPAPTAATAPGQQTVGQRIAEIDRLLSAPLTGRPEDLDQREALKNERAALSGYANHAVAKHQSVAPSMQSNRVAQDSANIVNYGPPTSQNNRIVVAPSPTPHDTFYLDNLTKKEREEYFRYLKLTHPNPIVGGYYDPHR